MDKKKREKLEQLYWKMTEWFAGDPKRIQHFVKVHSFAELIGKGEQLEEQEQFVLEGAALVHDIGIRPGEENTDAATARSRNRRGLRRLKNF